MAMAKWLVVGSAYAWALGVAAVVLRAQVIGFGLMATGVVLVLARAFGSN